MTNTDPNQQLLDYAVENITEWPTNYTHLRADYSSNPLFFSVGDDWSVSCNWWGHNNPKWEKVEGTLGKVCPQVITKDEWLAEIKRKKDEPYPSKFKVGEKVLLDSPWFSRYNGEYEVTEVVYEECFYLPNFTKSSTWKYKLGVEGETYWLESSLHKIEEIEMSKPLERGKVYDVKLTGEEIALCKLVLGRTNGALTYKAYCVFSGLMPLHPTIPEVNLSDLLRSEGKITEWLDKVFSVPETEEQRHLRELREQYVALGEKIKQMEK